MSTLSKYDFRGISLINDVFIETGTAQGATLSCAVSAGFKQLYSIELDSEAFIRAARQFQMSDNVRIICGTSPFALRSVIDRSQSTTFWLDAHFQGLKDYNGEVADMLFGECPLLAELDVIFAAPWAKQPIIIIDDEHMFRNCPERQQLTEGRVFDFTQWPSLDQIKSKLIGGYEIVIDDFKIYCLPKELLK